MEEVKILVLALVSFLSQENLPIAAKSAEINIDRGNKQVMITQYDIYSLEGYRDLAAIGLDSLMRATVLTNDLAPLKLVSKHFSEKDGKLNAVLYLQYEDIKDLRKVSFYSDEQGNLSYPYMESYNYGLETGKVAKRYVRFDASDDVKFTMEAKEKSLPEMYSLLDDWKKLEAKKYQDISAYFSMKDFRKARKFILEKGDKRSFRNIENNNPHYQFNDFGAYLASSSVFLTFQTKDIDTAKFDNLVLWGDAQYYIILFDENSAKNTNPYIANNKVYFMGPHLGTTKYLDYLQLVKSTIK